MLIPLLNSYRPLVRKVHASIGSLEVRLPSGGPNSRASSRISRIPERASSLLIPCIGAGKLPMPSWLPTLPNPSTQFGTGTISFVNSGIAPGIAIVQLSWAKPGSVLPIQNVLVSPSERRLAYSILVVLSKLSVGFQARVIRAPESVRLGIYSRYSNPSDDHRLNPIGRQRGSRGYRLWVHQCRL